MCDYPNCPEPKIVNHKVIGLKTISLCQQHAELAEFIEMVMLFDRE